MEQRYQMIQQSDGNTYSRPNVESPKNTIVWQPAGGNHVGYRTLSQYKSATGQEDNSHEYYTNEVTIPVGFFNR